MYEGTVRIFLQISSATSSLYTITTGAENTGNYSWKNVNFERDINTKETFCNWPNSFFMRVYLSVFHGNIVINFSSQQFHGIKPIWFTNIMSGALWTSHGKYNITWDHSLSEGLLEKKLVLQIIYLVALHPSNPVGAYDWYPLHELQSVNANDRVAEITVPVLGSGDIYGLKLYHPSNENSLFAITSLDYPIRICSSAPAAVDDQDSSNVWEQGAAQKISFKFDIQQKGYIFLTAIEAHNTQAPWIELNCGEAVSDCSIPICSYTFLWLTTHPLSTDTNYTVHAWWMPSNELDLDATGYRVELREVTIVKGVFFKAKEQEGFASLTSGETLTIYYSTSFSFISTIWVALVKDEVLYQTEALANHGNISILIGSEIPSGYYNLRLWVYPCENDLSAGIYEDVLSGLFITNTALQYDNLVSGMLISLGLLSFTSLILIMWFKCRGMCFRETHRTIMGKAIPKIGRDYATFKKQRMDKFGFNDIFQSPTASEELYKNELNLPINKWEGKQETQA